MNRLIGVLMYIITYLFIFNLEGFAITIYSLLLLLISILYIKTNNIKISKHSYFYLLYVCLLSLTFSIYSNLTLILINFIMLFLSMGYWLLVVSNTRSNDIIDENILKDIFYKIFIVPISKLNLLISNIFYIKVDEKNDIFKIVIGVIITLPIMIFIISLLSNTDTTFNKLTNFLIQLKFLGNLDIFKIVITLLVSSGFYSALILNVNKYDFKINVNKINIPDITLNTILISFISIYVIYILSVFYTYFTSGIYIQGANNIVSYARSGFFELSIVSFVNFMIFVVSKQSYINFNKFIKYLLTIIAIETILIVIIGFCKMYIYIYNYGLTYLRLFTVIFMIFIFISVILFIVGIFKEYNYVKYNVIIISSILLFVSYINIDKLVVSYNYINNKDIYLGYSNIPYLIKEYEKELDTNKKNNIKKILDDYKFNFNNYKKTINKNIEILNYEKMLDKIEK